MEAREIKPEEKRVALTPDGVDVFVRHGHRVLVEHGAGEGCGIHDADYRRAGALVKRRAADLWNNADMIIKVKEPLFSETSLIKERYLHLE